jgi:hypothetical protein
MRRVSEDTSMPNRILQAAVSAILAAGIFAGGLAVGQFGGAQAAAVPVWPERPLYAPGEMPSYPSAREHSLGDGLTLNQSPIRASYFQTDRSPETVAQFYLSAFGPDARLQRHGKDLAVVLTSFGSATTRTVLITSQNGVTYVFPSVYPVAAAPFRLAPDPDAEIPFDSDSMAAVDLRSGAEHGRVVSYQEMVPVDTAEKRYVETMAQRGYRLSNRQAMKGGTLLDFVGKHRVRVTLVPYLQKAPGTGVLAQVEE